MKVANNHPALDNCRQPRKAAGHSTIAASRQKIAGACSEGATTRQSKPSGSLPDFVAVAIGKDYRAG
jgi:hypothetical protein